MPKANGSISQSYNDRKYSIESTVFDILEVQVPSIAALSSFLVSCTCKLGCSTDPYPPPDPCLPATEPYRTGSSGKHISTESGTELNRMHSRSHAALGLPHIPAVSAVSVWQHVQNQEHALQVTSGLSARPSACTYSPQHVRLGLESWAVSGESSMVTISVHVQVANKSQLNLALN